MADLELINIIDKCPYCSQSFADKKRWNNKHNINMHIKKHPQSTILNVFTHILNTLTTHC